MADGMRVGVIGVGHLGKHHARILSGLQGARLTAVVDVLPGRAAEIAAAAGTRPMADSRDLLDEVDAVTVAVPTALHREVALPFLERGIAVLVEKPMAQSLAEADELIAAARASGAVLAVGADVRALSRRIDQRLTPQRSGPHDGRDIAASLAMVAVAARALTRKQAGTHRSGAACAL